MSRKKKSFTWFDTNSESSIPGGNITYVLAIAVPMIIFLALYIAKGIYPFGDNCFLRSDMYHQYAPFFAEFNNKISSGGSLLYSWDIGMGTNFTALYAYYLASPMNWLLLLIPKAATIEIMNIFIVIKLCLASFTLVYYLSKRFDTKSCTLTIFGVFYAMSGYVAAYNWNIMWMDCIWLLPLIILGLERLVKENKCLMYTVTLGLCIFTNYYIAIMVCITMVLYYIVLMIAYDGERSLKNYLIKFRNFALYSLLAGGLAAVMLLPEMHALSLTSSSDITFPKTLTEYFSILEMMVRHLVNIPVHMGLDHHPNIYCGLGILMLIPLYVVNKRIPIREKAGKLCILLIFLLAFNLNTANFIWHGLHFPNSLPARQSFIYIFFLLIMGYEAFRDLKKYENGQITMAFWIPFLFLLLGDQLLTNDMYDFKLFYVSGIFIMLYGAIMLMYRNEKVHRAVSLFLFFAVTIVECTMNMAVTGLSTTSRPAYVDDNAAIDKLLDKVEEIDDGFYRVEKLFGIRTKNDGAWHNYPSISVFSSMANQGVQKFFKDMGFESSANAYSTKGSTVFTNALFGVKYLLSNNEVNQSPYMQLVGQEENIYLYQNKCTLPLGFFVPTTMNEEWKSVTRTNIDLQNSFLLSATGVDNVFSKVNPYISGSSEIFTTGGLPGHLYGVMSGSSVDSLSVSINDRNYSYTGLDRNYTVDLGYVYGSETISISGDSDLNMTLYILNDTRFDMAFEKLAQGGLVIESFSETNIKGTVNNMEGEDLLFSIPYDPGWTVKVDGQKVDTYAFKDAFLAVQMEAGEHTVELSFTPGGLVPGLIITLVSLAILVVLYLIKSNRINFKKKTAPATKVVREA